MISGATDGSSAPAGGNDLAVRLASSSVLALVALAGAWFGGWAAAIVIGAAMILVHLEWIWLTGDRQEFAIPLTAGLVAALFFAAGGYWLLAMTALVALIIVAFATSREPWRSTGAFYAATFGLGLLALRLAPGFGLPALVFVLAIVWATDTGAFFAGRLIGGAKLWPAVSPKKTWAGAVGGLLAGVVAGAVVASIVSDHVGAPIWALGFVLSLTAMGGDLFESWVKRRFGAKDSGNLIPGHGGLMDRVDGLIFAAGVAVVIGWTHAGPSDIARGLLAW